MGAHYSQLDIEERRAIARLQKAGQSIRQIAAALERSPSSVSRELRRNGGVKTGYRPADAQERTRARRWTGTRAEREARRRAAI
ncbi:MAG: helix-turn-helix domain-containing protein [Rhodospirillales bacterium]|nr:helix-turn-helix domain-containing protein [Rhodospirillales bacterium]QQS13705.1 MAG: helix-turn-helix domain-containing protein [Rhodospirillales bacterium]